MSAPSRSDKQTRHDASSCFSVSEEIALLRRRFPRVNIQSATSSFLTASYERTPTTRIRVTLTFQDGYPKNPLIIDVTSDDVVPPGLKKKLEREMGKVAADLCGTHEQVCAVFDLVVRFVDGNKFLPCWKELRQCVDLVSATNAGDSVSASSSKTRSAIALQEAKGKINIRLQRKKYFYSCCIIVDDGYPSTKRHSDYGMPCRLKMTSTNFPPKIEALLTTQAQELVRRMQDGMPSSEALKMSNPVKAPKDYKSDAKEPASVRLTQEALKGLKKDTETLSYVRDLRNVDASTMQGNAKIKAHSAKERKDARRTINKITNTEIELDLEREENEKQWQIDEAARMAGYNISQYDGSRPQRSLLSVVTFLTGKIQRLPQEICPVCSKQTLPEDPEDLKALYLSASDAKTEKERKARRAARQKRPVRTYCGCWYHYDCLNKLMTEPPFGAACPTEGCGRRVFHPDWPSEIKELERAWANKQARAREIEDAAMFL